VVLRLAVVLRSGWIEQKIAQLVVGEMRGHRRSLVAL
jgi:hypothetical protein